MTLRIFVLLLCVTMGSVFAQQKKSKADNYFYAYAYADAIREYHKEMGKQPLTNAQKLNLADAYFKTGSYTNASKLYIEINKNDTIMSTHRFNKMLQSLSKTSEKDRVKAFLNSKSYTLTEETSENANFNYELLESGIDNDMIFEIFNINGNSPQSDFSPAFYKDKLLFSSGRGNKSKNIYGPSGEAYLDIYVARIDREADVINPNTFAEIPSSKFHKSTPFYSETLRKTFYVLSNAEDGELSFDENGKNSLAMGIAKNSMGANRSFNYMLRDLSTSFYYPFYQEATEKLFFAANFEDSYGGTDIYYVYTNNAQIMSEPINLGPRINSPGNEIAPFIYEDNLYFSSDVFYGMGGMDIYKSNIQGDEYSIPVNLGKDINSTFDDFGFIIKESDKSGYVGYFSSNRTGGKGNDDIYGFKVSALPGLKTVVLRGKVIKPITNNAIADVLVQILDTKGNILKEGKSNEEGDYRLEIPWRDNIIVQASKEQYSGFYKTFDKPALEAIESSAFDIEIQSFEDIVEQKEEKYILKLNDLVFAKGKYDISPGTALELDKVVDAVKQFPKMQLNIESHTDSRGYKNSNQKLSQNRANAIKAYLVKHGLTSSNITGAKGYGETKLTNNCKDGVYCLDFLHKQNERTLFVITNVDALK